MCFTRKRRRRCCGSKPAKDGWTGTDDNIGFNNKFKTTYKKINKRNDRRIHPEPRKPNTNSKG